MKRMLHRYRDSSPSERIYFWFLIVCGLLAVAALVAT